MQGHIKEAFYANLFLMMAESDRREITAREIDERREEKMLMLGPVLERLHDELLQPLVARVFRIMTRNGGLIPAAAQKASTTTACRSSSSRSSPRAQKAVGHRRHRADVAVRRPDRQRSSPRRFDRLDADGTMDAYADMTGAPASVLVDRKKAEQARQARAQAQQQQAALAGVQQLANTAKTASQIDVGGGQNAVAAMLGRGGGPKRRRPMSVPFEIPDWVIDTSPPQPPDTSGVDPHNVEDLVNRFIAGKQDVLFTGPDAYYRTRAATPSMARPASSTA